METLNAVFAVAQVFEPSIPSVPPAPFLERWVTGSGVPGAVVLAGLGVLLFVVLSRTPKHRLALPAGAALVLAGAGVLLTGRLVETPREALAERARGLVDAAVSADEPALRDTLHEDARVRTRFASAEGRDRIIPLSGIAGSRVDSHTVREVRVDLRGPRVARTQIRLSVDGANIPPASWWAVDWMRTTDDAPWVVTNIEPIWIQGMTDPAGP